MLRYPLYADQRADDPRTVAYNVESAPQANNVEFAAEPMIEGGMLLALLTPTADPIALDDSEDRVGTMPEFEILTEGIEDGPTFTEWHGQFVRAYDELMNGNVDIHDAADRAQLLYPKYRHRDLCRANVPW